MILGQTYPCLELIFVNDGSTDKTEIIVNSYKDTLQKRGIEFIYHYKKHSGLSATLNEGLKLFTGDYLIYPDIDDVILPSSIEKRVDFLEEHLEYGLVTSKGWEAEDGDLENRHDVFWMQTREENNLFQKIINREANTHSMAYMFRTESFLKINPQKKIYIHPDSMVQDVQMVLPMAYNYKCGFINEYLYIYIMHPTSHSHQKLSYPKQLVRMDSFEDIYIQTIRSINMSDNEYNRYKTMVQMRCIKSRKHILCNYLIQKGLIDICTVLNKIVGKRKLVIFGTGQDGEETFHLLSKKGISPVCFLDNDEKKQKQLCCGMKIKDVKEIVENKTEYFILIVTSRYNTIIKNQLIELGASDKKDFYTYDDFFSLLFI